jgi:hypothetical protein
MKHADGHTDTNIYVNFIQTKQKYSAEQNIFAIQPFKPSCDAEQTQAPLK